MIPFFAAVSLVLTIILFVVFFTVVTDKYSTRKDAMKMLNYMSKSRFYCDLSTIVLYYLMINKMDKMVNISKNYDFSADDLSYSPYINFDAPLNEQALNYSERATEQFKELAFQIAALAKEGVSPYEAMKQFVDDIVTFRTCNDGKNLETKSQLNLNNVYTFSFFVLQNLSVNEHPENFYQTNDDYCHLQLNIDELSNSVNNLYEDICNYQVQQGEDMSKSANAYMIAIPIIIFVVSFGPLCANSLAYVHRMNKFAESFRDMDKQGKSDAIKPILKNLPRTEHPVSTLSHGLTKMLLFAIIIFILSLAAAILFLFMIYVMNNGSNQITQIVRWQFHSSILFSQSIEAVHSSMHIISLNDSAVSQFTNRSAKKETLEQSLDILKHHYTSFFAGTADSDPCTGFDSELDYLAVEEECPTPEQVRDFHDTYRCSSTQKMYNTFITLIQYIMSNPDQFNGIIDGQEPVHLIELVNNHFLYKLEKISERFQVLIEKVYDDMVGQAIIFLVFGLIVAIFQFIFSFVIGGFCNETYQTALSMGRRIPPINIVQSKKMKATLLCQSETDGDKQIQSVSQNILHNSNDAIISTSSTLVIEMVNPAITEILGFTPDQLLGQPISIAFNEKDGDTIMREMAMMKDGTSSIYENHLRCVSDSMNEVPCLVTALAIKTKGVITSFVFILKNETEMARQQKEAEQAKAQSEHLLYQILPRDIVMKINSGEKDISFSVPTASILFIDIVKFSEYASSLTPSEIMGNLSIVFACFDSLIANYPLITKIKLIGDIYMAASGLFETEDKPVEHATQTIKFALDCLQNLDDVNIKLNANLQVRIGMNTGGPLIAGVLGSDKPVFDIIGDPINVAARLQTTDVPGMVQITQGTYDCISALGLQIEPRGEVFLKGKGKTNTYLVSPADRGFTMSSTSQGDNNA